MMFEKCFEVLSATKGLHLEMSRMELMAMFGVMMDEWIAAHPEENTTSAECWATLAEVAREVNEVVGGIDYDVKAAYTQG